MKPSNVIVGVMLENVGIKVWEAEDYSTGTQDDVYLRILVALHIVYVYIDK